MTEQPDQNHERTSPSSGWATGLSLVRLRTADDRLGRVWE